MTSNNIVKTDLLSIYNVVQNTMTYHMKSLVLSTLKDFFRKDSLYRYSQDVWGFNNTPDHTNMPLDAGVYDHVTTRLCIQEAFRMEANFFPALIVKAGGITSVPISFNRENSSIQYEELLFYDAEGNKKIVKVPQSYIFAGAWEGSISIDVLARDPRTRDDLVDAISLAFVDHYHTELIKEGLVITGVSTAGSSESDDRNTKLFKDTVSLKTRSEWRRNIPIGNTIDIINLAIEFGKIPDGTIAQNLTINTEIELTQSILDL